MEQAFSPYLPLKGKKILLGMTGGIALFKVAEFSRKLMALGAEIIPVMTRNAQRFVAPLTFQALCGQKVYSDMFEEKVAETIPHIHLPRKADLFLVMPATANFLAKAATGLADDLLSTMMLSYRGPVLIHPSMNPFMYAHPATQNNISKLRELGYGIIEPATGSTACGEEGKGRLNEWPVVKEEVLKALSTGELSGVNVLITAGPTREPIDPVRFVSNRSSGKMGYSMAHIAYRRGADVTLISGPVALEPPHGVKLLKVETAEEMAKAAMDYSKKAGIIVMTAAVSDYAPVKRASHKIKKGGKQKISIELERTMDILSELAKRRKRKGIIAGFCAETKDLKKEARKKLSLKGVDMIIANDVSQRDAGFDVDTNRVILVDAGGSTESLPLLYKEEVAERVWDRLQALFREKTTE
jgi:phosphopantothenoylcysteine decarboxylase/phosphopantothenate--cysteine ligase